MRKMLKKLGVVIPSVVLTLLMAVGFSTPAFAYVEPEVKEEPVQVIEEEKPTEEEKIPFTIAGNGEVEDNITDDSSKEFFTVKTKGGNTFFLVIDRARNSENVYIPLLSKRNMARAARALRSVAQNMRSGSMSWVCRSPLEIRFGTTPKTKHFCHGKMSAAESISFCSRESMHQNRFWMQPVAMSCMNTQKP